MRYIILICLLLQMSANAIAQHAEVALGEPIDNKTNICSILGQDDEGNTYVLANKGNNLFLEKYVGTAQRQTISKEIELPEFNGFKQTFVQIEMLKDNFVLFAKAYDKKADEYHVNAYSVSKSFIISPTAYSITVVEASRKQELKDIVVEISSDKTKILIGSFKQVMYGDPEMEVKIFDENFKVINEYKKIYKREDRSLGFAYEMQDINLANDGAFYFGLTVWEFKEGLLSYRINGKVSIISVDEIGHADVIYFEMDNLKIGQVSFTIDKNNNYHAIGYYLGEQSKGLAFRNWVQGVFYLKIDGKTKEKLISTKEPFSDELLLNFLSQKKLDKGKGLPNNYIPRKLMMTEDGSFYLASEYYELDITTLVDQNGNKNKRYTYHYDDILLTKVNPKGEISWTKPVFKSQFYSSGIYSTAYSMSNNSMIPYFSALIMPKGNDIYMFFNDDPKNISTTKSNKLATYCKVKESAPFLVKIDEDGNQTKKLLTNLLNQDAIIRPVVSKKIVDGKYVVFATMKKVERLGVLTIE